MLTKYIKELFTRDFELIIWLSILVYLFILNRYLDPHFSFCIFNKIGIVWCPGCGLGKAVSFFIHGEVVKSIYSHPLGIPATIFIALRIYKLVETKIFLVRLKYGGQNG